MPQSRMPGPGSCLSSAKPFEVMSAHIQDRWRRRAQSPSETPAVRTLYRCADAARHGDGPRSAQEMIDESDTGPCGCLGRRASAEASASSAGSIPLPRNGRFGGQLSPDPWVFGKFALEILELSVHAVKLLSQGFIPILIGIDRQDRKSVV